MALPASGTIKMSQVDVELSQPANKLIRLGQTDVRQLAVKTSGKISMSDLRGKVSDITPPTVTITSSRSSIGIGQTATLTFTLSESSTDFALADITLSPAAGTLTAFAGSGTVYTAKFTPYSDWYAWVTVSVPVTTFRDPAGNYNKVGASYQFHVDTTVPPPPPADTTGPGVSISAVPASFSSTSQTGAITLNFDETPTTSLVQSNVTVTGADIVAGTWSGSGARYSFTIRPWASFNGRGAVEVAANVVRDSAGNWNTGNLLPLTINTIPPISITNPPAPAVDTTPPTVSISSNRTSVGRGETATISISLSESSTNFRASSISVNGGSLTGFSGSGRSYSITFVPEANRNNPSSVWVNANTFTDAAGNYNSTGSGEAIIYVNTLVPLTVTAESSEYYFTYDSMLRGGTITLYPQVFVSGGTAPYTYSWSVISGTGWTWYSANTSRGVVGRTFTKQSTIIYQGTAQCRVQDATGQVGYASMNLVAESTM